MRQAHHRSMRAGLLVIAMIVSACATLDHPPFPELSAGSGAAVVFDIDGTLTPDVTAIRSVRPGAAEAVGVLAQKGYTVIYLSARHPWFQSSIRGWLRRHGFPEGHLFTAQSYGHNQEPVAFKTGVLEQWQERGWRLRLAYGDSDTDFEAYASVGIPADRVFALRRRGDEACRQGAWSGCLDGWPEHLPFLREYPSASPTP